MHTGSCCGLCSGIVHYLIDPLIESTIVTLRLVKLASVARVWADLTHAQTTYVISSDRNLRQRIRRVYIYTYIYIHTVDMYNIPAMFSCPLGGSGGVCVSWVDRMGRICGNVKGCYAELIYCC